MRTFLLAASTVLIFAGNPAIGQRALADHMPADSATAVLAGHHPLWARGANDRGLIAGDARFDHLTLVLARSPEKEKALTDFLASQQDHNSANYHHWLNPVEFGSRFGLPDEEMEPVIDWLKSQNLRVNWISPSRMFVDFGGTAEQVGAAFHTEFHRYSVRDAERVSVASDPTVPGKLASAIKSVRGLYTIDEKPMSSGRPSSQVSPDLTLSNGDHFLTPGDFATIYDLPSTLTGSGQAIGVVGRSRVDKTDLDNFRSLTYVSFADPTEIVPTALGGVDPGPAYTSPPGTSVSLSDQLEATLDVTRAGSTAPASQVLLVVATAQSGGIGVATQYLVQTTPIPANVINISFGACELNAGAAGVNYWDTLFQQAAGEGISVFVSSGDSGASGCDADFTTPPVSPQANSPNYICSSSYATCVGGTEFNDFTDPAQYWGTNNTNLSSALSYIPEGAWNEPLDSKSNPQIAASGGGVSKVIATPSWQTGTGVPSARAGRYTPDLAFSASGHDGYFACFAAAGASCVANSQGQYEFEYFFGTSAAAPSMAAITALLNEQVGVGQGNLNPALYATAASSPASFHDVTLATSGVGNCEASTPSMCNNSAPGPTALTGGQAGYLVDSGYDEVTGLGSLDVSSFLNFYNGAKLTPKVHVTLSPTSITSAQQLYIFLQVSGPGKNTPSGSVVVTSGSYTSPALPLLSDGSANALVLDAHVLPAGNDTITATYTPDSASIKQFNPATGTASVTVTAVAKITPSIQVILPQTSSVTTAQQLYVDVQIYGGQSGGNPNENPTGTMVLMSGTYTSAPATLRSSINEAMFTVPAGVLAVGQDTLTATYTPDAISAPVYNGTSGAGSVTVTAAPITAPSVAVTLSGNSITTAQTLTVSVVVSTSIYGNVAPSGSIIITSANYNSGAIKLDNFGAATITIAAGALAVGADTVIVAYTPDSASSAFYTVATGTASVTVATPPVPTFTVAGTTVTVAPGAKTGNSSTVTVTPSGGFTGAVTLTAAITSSPTNAQDPPTLSFGTSSPVGITGGVGTATLSVLTTAPTSALLARPAGRSGNWYASGGAVLACAVLWGIPARRRSWKRVILGIFALLVIFTSGATACGGGGSTTNQGNPGTTAGSYTVTVTATSGSITQTANIGVVVQ